MGTGRIKHERAPFRPTKEWMSPADVREAIAELCKEKSYNPFEELIDLATGFQDQAITNTDGSITKVKVPICDTDQKIKIATELAQYIAPKLKSMEVAGKIDTKLEITITQVGGPIKTIEAAPVANTVIAGAAAEGLGNASDVQRLMKDRVVQPGDKKTDVLGEDKLDLEPEEKGVLED